MPEQQGQLEQAVTALLEAALTNPQSEFKPITYFSDYLALKDYISRTKKLTKELKRVVNNISNQYMGDVAACKPLAPDVLFGERQMLSCYEFFSKELEVAEQMKQDYRNYL